MASNQITANGMSDAQESLSPEATNPQIIVGDIPMEPSCFRPRADLLTDGDRCLLVLDDVSDPEVVRPFIPVGGTARVLITSNRQSAASLGSLVPVHMFSAGEASAFLAERTGWDDEAGAAAVAAALDHLPLALALAASVMAGEPRVDYVWYLYRLQSVPVDPALGGDHGEPWPARLDPGGFMFLHG